MRHEYEIFERFPDGSTVLRWCVHGWYEAERKIYELAEHSESEFYAIDIQTNRAVTPSVKSALLPTTKAAADG
jgi:hypothetical protein